MVLPVRFSRVLFAGVAAALITLSFSGGKAQAGVDFGCSFDDLVQAGKDTYNNAPVACSAQLENPGFYALTAFLIGAMQTPEGKAFCNSAMDVNASIDENKKKLADYWGQVPVADQDKIKKELPYFAKISELGTDAASALDTVTCACKVVTWKGPGAVAKELGQCAAEGLCAMQNWAHDHLPGNWNDCKSSPPPQPQLIDCGPDPRYSDSTGWHWKDNVPWVGDEGQCGEHWVGGEKAGQWVAGYTCIGDYCYSDGLLKTGGGNYCYCPEAMRNPDNLPGAPNSYMYDYGSCLRYLTCACPANTKPLGDSGAAAYMCMCPESGLPVNADGSCPKKCDCGCANNQIQISKDYKSCTCNCGCPEGQFKLGDTCVSPCANASDVMLAGGGCCAASQASSCGSCCPLGMKPGTNGTCVSALMPQAPKGPVLQPNSNLFPQKKP